jgi:protein subunit release factor A
MASSNSQQEQYNQGYDVLTDITIKFRDIEEKQNILKDRVLLIGENLVSVKEDADQELAQLKLRILELEEEVKKIKLNLQSILESTDNFARKNEVDILKRQFQMFQPLEFARISDVEALIKKHLKTQNK